MFRKLLVANRGEIAIRAFRAAYELDLRTAAVYAPEDRDSVHRLKADESYEIGEPGHPVSTYLDIELIVALAQRIGADAIYPGYGFMSENPELARQCAAAGIRSSVRRRTCWRSPATSSAHVRPPGAPGCRSRPPAGF